MDEKQEWLHVIKASFFTLTTGILGGLGWFYIETMMLGSGLNEALFGAVYMSSGISALVFTMYLEILYHKIEGENQ